MSVTGYWGKQWDGRERWEDKSEAGGEGHGNGLEVENCVPRGLELPGVTGTVVRTAKRKGREIYKSVEEYDPVLRWHCRL